jgi:hypothetical protein
LLTPSDKLKRAVAERKYKQQLEAIYEKFEGQDNIEAEDTRSSLKALLRSILGNIMPDVSAVYLYCNLYQSLGFFIADGN